VVPVPVGSTAIVDVVVTPEMTVDFDELEPVHPVYATYTMAKYLDMPAEGGCRRQPSRLAR
jgi:fluoroacetyl-CoA thioesterase